ncbi:hypothetical protein LY10_04121 [Planktotalea frisia]|uniref:Probable membrane transporter protein n=2 Tax=Planktotalea frisia TaxID=696762 RepID=A0A1L9P0W3_9RHOB|nr:sulfite exporter TauE/SafE [Planktotalea frisia]PZX18740.1 hypothetical protein LY10_04121 [Planktotalea frisia]
MQEPSTPSALSDPYAIIIIFAALFCGGTLKGALGMGSPVVAVPVMASFVDVRLAVVVMVVPNLITNIAQIRTYKSARMQGTFSMRFALCALRFALAGAFGAGVGSFALVLFSATVLKIIVACAVLDMSRFGFCGPTFRSLWNLQRRLRCLLVHFRVFFRAQRVSLRRFPRVF